MKVRQLAIILGLLLLVVSMTFGVMLMMNMTPPGEQDLRPQLVILNPSEDEILSGVVDIRVNITDEESLESDIFIDGVLVTTANDYNWDTTQYPDGRHTLRFFVEDSAEQDDIEYFEIMIDNDADTVYTADIIKIMVYNIKESGIDPSWKTVVKQESPDILVLVETGYFDDQAN
ncbi:MAG: Ig-like domain-containing protein, partial [Candidatus Thorarchaeota archaeon]